MQYKKPGANSWVYVRQHCAKIDEAARNRMELIVRSLADEIVKAELIYN